MSTRSLLCLEHKDGKIEVIYCHNDGYPEHHAPILEKHYMDRKKVERLMKLGNLSQLAPNLERPTGSKFFEINDSCAAYGRDRGDDHQESRVYSDFKAFREFANFQQYNYLFTTNNEWVMLQR